VLAKSHLNIFNAFKGHFQCTQVIQNFSAIFVFILALINCVRRWANIKSTSHKRTAANVSPPFNLASVAAYATIDPQVENF